MSLFGHHNPLKKSLGWVGHNIERVFKGSRKIVGGALDFLLGDRKPDDISTPQQPKPVQETPIQTPTQQQMGSPAGGSDVGLGDVISIFDKDEKDPFKKFLM